jgi:hypothetical protein
VKILEERRVRVWQATAILHGHSCPLQDPHQVVEGIFVHGGGDVQGRNAGLHHLACFTKPEQQMQGPSSQMHGLSLQKEHARVPA